MNRFFALAFLFGNISCAAEITETDQNRNESLNLNYTGKPGTTQSRDQAYFELQTQDIAFERDKKFTPENFLKHLHGAFNSSKSGALNPYWLYDRQIMILSPLNNKIVNELKESTFNENFSSGFEILQHSFWRKVQELQQRTDPISRKKLQIGFLKPDMKFIVNGAYYQQKGIIVVDLFASQGTLEHEFRHHLQSQAFKSRDQKRKTTRYPTPLSDECIRKANTYFGELDSTTTELHNWIGVSKTLKVDPVEHQKIDVVDPIALFPQIQLFDGNLQYPNRIENILSNDICGSDLAKANMEIGSSTDRFYISVFDQKASNFSSLRYRHLKNWEFINESCVNNSKTPEIEKKCEAAKSKITSISAEALELSNKIDDELKSEVIDRPARIRKILNDLPFVIRQQLCWESKAFEFLTECREFFGEQR